MKILKLNMELRDLHHELHIPLTGSLGASQLLAETSLDAEQKDLVDMIIKSNERLLDFIDNQVLNSKNELSENKQSFFQSTQAEVNKPVLLIKFSGISYQNIKLKAA